MRTYLFLIALSGCTSALHWQAGGKSSSPSSSSPAEVTSISPVFAGQGEDDFAKTATSGPEAWKRYELRGIQLGTPRKKLAAAGFTCGKRANSRCFKILDERCKKGTCELKVDEAFGDQWFELNGTKTSLEYISCATTETDSALTYDCHLEILPRQLLTKDSTLGKALIGKYGNAGDIGEPSNGDPEGGGRMMWWNPEAGYNAPVVNADCDSPLSGSGYTRHYCSVTISDGGITKMERAKQDKVDKQRMLDNQPKTAPRL